jgi:hypothetical protein
MTFREKGIGLKLWWGPRFVAYAKLLSVCSFDFFWRNIPYIIIYPYYVVLCELQDAISMVANQLGWSPKREANGIWITVEADGYEMGGYIPQYE